MSKQLSFEFARVSELSLKYKPNRDLKNIQITCPEDAVVFLRKIWNDLFHIKESFYVVLLNNQKYVNGYALISMGGQTATIVDPAEIFRFAILGAASSILLAHNHPSGNPQESEADTKLTMRIVESGKLLGIPVDDHIIMTESFYTSFKERNLI